MWGGGGHTLLDEVTLASQPLTGRGRRQGEMGGGGAGRGAQHGCVCMAFASAAGSLHLQWMQGPVWSRLLDVCQCEHNLMCRGAGWVVGQGSPVLMSCCELRIWSVQVRYKCMQAYP